jgi:uncharacterized protein YceH (UPF0502 family)
VEPDAVEIRVLGCLLEKQRTTPDSYPLTLNALRTACNQSTNRDPVVDYSERDVRAALERLGRRRWTRLASWGNSRVMKYRHLLDETLELSDAELSVLAVLMLRGPQTLGELNQRTERLHRFEGDELEQTLEQLVGQERVRQLPRRPGERGSRYLQLLGGAEAASAAPAHGGPADEPSAHEAPAGAPVADEAASPSPAAPSREAPSDDAILAGELVGRVEHLERELAALRAELTSLRSALGD